MTQQQIKLVQQCWESIRPISKQAGFNFYEKLFAAAPGIRHLFKEDITEQSGKLAMMLNFVVGKLHRINDIKDDIRKLGVTHNQYGAKKEHYDLVGKCLLETLQEGLGNKWNDELKDSWIAVYEELTETMIKAQEQAANVQPAA